MAGLRNGFTLSVTGAVVGMVMGGQGLGRPDGAARPARHGRHVRHHRDTRLARLPGVRGTSLVERRSATIAALRHDQEE
jgi:hypothetical protein